MTYLNKLSCAFIAKCGISVILLLFPASLVRAQAPTDNGAPLGLAPGSPEGAYALSGFENINLYNGGLSFGFPVQQIGGRGMAGYTAHVPIESKWMVRKDEWYDEVNNAWVKWYVPSVAEYYGEDYGPGSLSVRYSTWKPEGCYIGWDYYTTFRWATTSIIFKAPDGTEHELVGAGSMGQPTNYPSCSLNGNNRGPVFVSRDHPGMTFISDIEVRDAPYFGSGRIKGHLKMPDGTVYRFDEIPHCYQWGCWYETRLTWMRDPNGNITTFTYAEIFGYGTRITAIKDSLNRQVTIEYGVTQTPYGTHDRLTYKGFGGANRVVRVQRNYLSTALRSDFTIQTLKQLFPTLDGAEDAYNPSVTTAIWLPDSDGVTRRYRFFYNSYGELSRVELPTGGAIEYDWGPGLANGANGGLINPVPNVAHWMDLDEEMPQIYRRLLARRGYDSGNVLLGSTTYSRPETQNGDNSISNLGYVGVSHQAPNAQQLAAEVHYFYGSPATSFFTWQASPAYLPTYSPFAAYRDGREYQTDLYAANGTTLLRRTNQAWDQPPLSWWYGSAETSPANNPFVKETVTTLGDSGQVTKTTNVNPQTGQIMIDQFGNPLDVWIYDYGQGQPGPLLRRMHTEFLTVNPVNGVDYTNRTSPSGPHRFSLPTRTSVYDANGVERGRTTFEYDNYTTDANHATLIDRPGISGFDPSFNMYYSTRGNATATTRYLLTNGSVTGTITGYVQYDIAGNTVKTLDARGNPTNFYFDDRFGAPDGEAQANISPYELSSAGQYSYAFATRITNALGHQSYSQFDYYLGKLVDSEDANGTTHSGYYEDAIDRPTKVISAANRDVSMRSQSVYSYDELNRTITTISDFNIFNENPITGSPLKSMVLYDGMGRTTETRSFEGGSAYIAVQQRYDALGRVNQTSNPFRNGETPVWTTTTFDELSRVLSVTTPDNAATSNSYSGNTATASDQTGKKRKSVTDGLGRLTAVYEDPLGVNHLTTYSYDTLDNLTTVIQGSQTRSFVYDSLNRVTSSTDPESGAVFYVYDHQGNLTQKTDARGWVTNVSYDALNRPTAKSYQNDGGITPAVAYFYDSQTLPGGAPTFNRGYSTGRAVAVTYGGGSAGDYFGYDAKGRPSLKIQQTGAVNYQMTAVYNVAGVLTAATYPSGRTVSYGHDAAGRTNSFTGTLGDGAIRNYSTGISYSSFGGLTQEQFGTNTLLYNKRHYNVRGQLYDVRISTFSLAQNEFDWNRGCLALYYGGAAWGQSSATNNGNMTSQQHWTPLNEALSDYGYTQQGYNYDSLNRLSSISELHGGPWGQSGTDFIQTYNYDRWGNRTIHQTATWGAGIPKPNFGVDTNTNRLTPPAGYTMNYDQVGNLTTDTYTGEGARVYDAENRMKQAWASVNWQIYSYDGSGRRTRRLTSGSETWQVFGIDGALMAEYAANASPSSPQKEYGYRNGELLVTATSGPACGVGYQGAKNWTATHPSVGHATGQQEGSNWAAYAGTHSPHAMVYGPYDNAFGQGQHKAQFTLMVDNNSGSDVVATLDVVTAYGTNVLAVRQIRRNEFTAANQWQTFTVPFNNPCFGLVEARVWWAGNTNTKFSQMTISSVSTSTTDVRWLLADHLGTPRIILDQSGSLANVSRHDYLPFGEELYAGTGGRTTAHGYTWSDNVRQKFTSYERDHETGLDYANARYYAHAQGRFTGIDPVGGVASAPQSWNRYTYSLNNPINFTDPTGMFANAEYGSDPGRESDPFLDYSKKWFRLTSQIQQALDAYDQMVKDSIAAARLQQQKKDDEKPVATQTATTTNVPQCGASGQVPVTVVVDQMNNPGVRTRDVNGTNSLVLGVDLRFTFLDEQGQPVTNAVVGETVENLEGQRVTTSYEPVPLNQNGEGADLVSNNSGPVPTSRAGLDKAVDKFNADFTTRQRITLTVVTSTGITAQVIQERTLTNRGGAPGAIQDVIRGYTFTMGKPTISILRR